MSQPRRARDMSHISNVEPCVSKDMEKKDIRQQIGKSLLRWGAQWELPSVSALETDRTFKPFLWHEVVLRLLSHQ